MIVLHETNENYNQIKLIIGAESEVMMRMHGNMTLDISPIMNQLDQNKPVLLSVGRVDSEAGTLGLVAATGAKPPFVAPLAVIDTTGKTADGVYKDLNSKSDKTGNRAKVKQGKCPLCAAEGDIICVEGEKPICPSCFKIEQGLKKTSKKKKNK